jgi:flagella basal body P-ring formation protein FlgA
MIKMIFLTTICILTSAVLTAAPLPQSGEKLCISLAEEVVADTAEVSLGQIATLTGPVELVDKAKRTALGTFSTKGQVLYADRNTILSRLASVGISAWQVELAGAKTTAVRRNETRIEPQRITGVAKAYLDKQLAGQKIALLAAVRAPSAVVLSEPNALVELTAQMSRYQTPGTKKITVTVNREGIPVAQREVAFAVQFQIRRAVAARNISLGTVIRSDDVRIEQVDSSVPEPAGWKEPFGLSARRQISEGAVIHPEWIGSANVPTLVRRNQQVMVQINTGAMSLSAPGQALDEGRVGELIRVRRGEKPDERIIYCTVQPNGTVCPQI